MAPSIWDTLLLAKLQEDLLAKTLCHHDLPWLLTEALARTSLQCEGKYMVVAETTRTHCPAG